MSTSKEWRKKQRIISDEELSLLVKNINKNMKDYANEDIEKRMERSDRIELDMHKVRGSKDERVW